MTTSSVPKDYLTTSNSSITIDSETWPNINASGTISNITLNTTGSGYYYSPVVTSSIFTTGSTSASTVTISNIGNVGFGTGSFSWTSPQEFVDCFPAWNRIEEMCRQYPGLQIAFEKFKTTYYLVKDDYDTPENERPLP